MSSARFTSAFAADLEGYLAFKQNMGCYGASRIWYLRQGSHQKPWLHGNSQPAVPRLVPRLQAIDRWLASSGGLHRRISRLGPALTPRRRPTATVLSARARAILP
jgi:hypothetical protein